MPVDFVTDDQRQTYGAFPVAVPLTDLAQFFYLDDADWESIASRRGDYNRLGYSLQRCTLRYLGAFLPSVTETPVTVEAYLARQLAIPDPSSALARYQDLEARWDHQVEICAACGYVPFGDATMALPFVRMLYIRCWTSAERPSVLFDAAVAWLREQQVVLPGITTLERVIDQVRERVAVRVWGRLRDAVPVPQRQRLESLLALVEPLPTGRRISGLEDVRQRERRTSSSALIRALERLERIRDLGVGDLDLSAIPARRLKSLADYATTSKVTTIAELAEDRRIATLVAFVQAAEATAADDALDVLDGVLDDVLRSAVRTQRATRLRTLRDLDKAALTLAERTRDLLVQREGAATDLATYLTMHEPELTAAITQIMVLARRPDEGVQRELEGKYRTVRRFLPKVLTTLDFATTPAAQPIKDAGRFLQQMEGMAHPAFATAPLAFVPPAWRAHVAPPDGLINRKLYTVCFLLQLQEGLRKREIFVPGSSHWSDPRAKLYTGAEWDRLRPTLCQALNRSQSADEEITVWQRELDERYQKTLGALTPTSTVRVLKSIDAATGKETQRLQIDALAAQPETPSLKRLRWLTEHLMPLIDLPTLILEVEARTGFAQAFMHIGEGESRLSDFRISLCAALLIMACNLPVTAVAKAGIPALTEDRLIHVQQNYLRPETIARANARLVEIHTQIPLTAVWGGGEVASADGLRFVVPVRSLNAGPNRKYFGARRGATLINYALNHFFGFNGAIVAGTLRDSRIILDGLLEQESPLLQPQEIMTDNASYSDLVFGLFALLGYRFSPRLADIGDTRFWRFDRTADYGALQPLSRNYVSAERIRLNWDDMLRVAASLKIGRVRGSEVIAMVGGEKPSTLGKAIMEVGRIAKTYYLLDLSNDETYQRRILIQLNRGEARHSLARNVFHGRKGELRQPYREGMEEQLGVLGLVVNMIVLWNTLYLERSVADIRARGISVATEDLERLSPLGSEHIAFGGNYPFVIAEYIRQGAYLPLRAVEDQEIPSVSLDE